MIKINVASKLAICENQINYRSIAFKVVILDNGNLEKSRQEINEAGFTILEEVEINMENDNIRLLAALMSLDTPKDFDVDITRLLEQFYLLGRKHEREDHSKE